ncbi:hypothetical protein AZ34_14945 [Hylemonella gracilis str. Niagara R]|uniref:Uncharacterized protein n=1 Tax=Hylemonella gracilis str. Niagara R TaxID=1458275 RepID=A0A016XN02_9BURK|nr:hypothetical protein [Hylemonella gracilis]EYC52957.1 hypothetical protein AZ34_14945 [Hylemonella gracilis str. Niagara R]
MTLQAHPATSPASPHQIFSVTVDALTREIYETASPAMRARMKAQACARVMPELTLAQRAQLQQLLRHGDTTVLAEIQNEEPDWAAYGVGAALLWMLETDLRSL